MQYIEKRRRGLKEWEDLIIKLLLSLIFVIPIVLIIVNASDTVVLENEKETTIQSPTIASPSQESTNMQSIPEEEQIAHEAVITAKTALENASTWSEVAKQENEGIAIIADSVKTATTLAELTEIRIYAVTASSAATEAAINAMEETEKAVEAMLEAEIASDVFSELRPHYEIANEAVAEAITEANSAIDAALYTEEIANEVIAISAEKSKLIHTIARVIYAEAHGEPLLGKVAVGATIVNRLNSEYFPDTIEEVLEGQYARYHWVTDEHLARYPECVDAAERALMGEDPLAEELGEPTVYFLNPETSVQEEVELRKGKKNATIGHHMFSGLSLYW